MWMRTDSGCFQNGRHTRRRHHISSAELREDSIRVAQKTGSIGAQERRTARERAEDLHDRL